VQLRFLHDRSFTLYVVVFRITQSADGAVTDVHFDAVYDVRYHHEHPGTKKMAQITIPAAYLAAADKKIRKTRYSPLRHTGRPEQGYVPFYYAPRLGDRVIVDVSEPE
jgi:hypothetical protein